MKSSPPAELLTRYLRNDCTPAEVRLVEQWYEARDQAAPAPPTAAERAGARARMWRQVQARTRPVRWRTAPRRWVAAAVLALSLGVGLNWLLATRRLINQAGLLTTTQAPQINANWLIANNVTGQTMRLALADGSTVRLAPGSWLRYPARFGARGRTVRLQGEAFFEVFHDPTRPFRVQTDKVETTVLGTSFTVRAFPGAAEALVQVRTGRVRVQATRDSTGPGPGVAAAPALVLRPNQQVRYSPATHTLRPELVARPALLQAAALHFDQRPVAEVLAALEASYGVPIRYNGAAVAGCTVSLAFVPDQSLFDRLDLLCRALGGSYERNGLAIDFRGAGCLSE